MKNPRPVCGPRGFSLIELLVVMALAAILMFISMPVLMTSLRAAKMRGIAQEAAVLMRQARLNAIKTSTQAVVRIVPATATQPIGRVEGFSDRNSDGKLDATDPVLGRFDLPTHVSFLDEAGNVDSPSVAGLSVNPENGAMPNVAIFQRDGSIATVGAFRFGDEAGNLLEVRVEPAATARVEVRKWQGGRWIANGDNGEAWSWN